MKRITRKYIDQLFEKSNKINTRSLALWKQSNEMTPRSSELWKQSCKLWRQVLKLRVKADHLFTDLLLNEVKK